MLIHARRLPGSRKAIVYAVLVHLALIALIVIGFRWHSRPAVAPAPIQAKVMPDDAAQKELERLKRQEREREQQEAKKQREQGERERQTAEAQRREQQAKLAEQKRRDEEKRKTTEALKQREAAQRQADARKKKEAEQRRQAAVTNLKEQLVREEKERAAAAAQAAQAARDAKEEDRYRGLITQQIMGNWVPPPDWSKGQGMECSLRVRLVPTGEVIQVTTACRNSSDAFDRSVRNAVYKASPLPVPEDKTLFESRFRELQFNFHPEGKP